MTDDEKRILDSVNEFIHKRPLINAIQNIILNNNPLDAVKEVDEWLSFQLLFIENEMFIDKLIIEQQQQVIYKQTMKLYQEKPPIERQIWDLLKTELYQLRNDYEDFLQVIKSGGLLEFGNTTLHLIYFVCLTLDKHGIIKKFDEIRIRIPEKSDEEKFLSELKEAYQKAKERNTPYYNLFEKSIEIILTNS